MGKPSNNREIYLICALLIIATVAVYWQVAGFQFVNFDDQIYVRDNPLVNAGLSPLSVKYAFSPYEANWIPLVWISYMIEHDMGSFVLDSASPGIYHLTNAVLHTANAVLLFLVLVGMTGRRWRSGFVAALFALHPLHVESVAWIAERKDVLSTLFWMLTMLAYLRYVRKSDARRYGFLVLMFVLGLMSKSMLVTLPVVLVLLDYWPLGRTSLSDGRPGIDWGRVRVMVLDKMPLFGLVGAACIVTVWAQGRAGAMGSLDVYPVGVRVANALVAYVAYIGKMVWPVGLSFMYVHPGNTLPVWQVIASGVGLAIITVVAFRAAQKYPYLFVGWMWYVITLIPVIGLIQVGKQAMADRYTYVPLIGVFIIIAWGVPDLLARRVPGDVTLRTGPAAPLAVCAIAVIGVLAVLTYRQVGTWRDSIALCTHAIRVEYKNPLAHVNLGRALMEQDDIPAAMRQFRIALTQRSDYTDAYFNLGTLLGMQGKYGEAAKYLKKGLKYWPSNAEAHSNLGNVLRMQGKLPEAIREYREAIRLDPRNESFRTNLQNAENGVSP